ncbi:GIY-YIG nuclease family protein [Pseudomonas nicosulfuronedens]
MSAAERIEALPKPGFLYRHFDADGALLYVGISLNAISRLAQHKDHAHWFQLIARVEIEQHPSREAAIQAEKIAITKENPRHNLVRPAPPKQSRGAQASSENLISRLVSFNPTYSIKQIAEFLGVRSSKVNELMDKGILSFYEIEGPRSGGHEPKIHRKCTGWQLIDYLESLQSN